MVGWVESVVEEGLGEAGAGLGDKGAFVTEGVVLSQGGSAGSCKELRRLISAGVPGLHEHPRLVR